MNTIFKNSENSKTPYPHNLSRNLMDKISLRGKNTYIALSNLSIYYKWKKSYKQNKFKISAPAWNEVVELPNGSYSISGIQGCFEYILKKQEKNS